MKVKKIFDWWAGGGAFLPSSFSGLKFWSEGYKIIASEIVGGVLTDGADVDHINDHSGEDSTVTPSSAAKRPSYETNEVNGRPVLRFGSGTDTLRGIKVDFDFLHQGDSTVILLIKPSDITTNQVLFDSTNDGSSNSHGRRIEMSTSGKIADKCYAQVSGQYVFNSISANAAITINAWNLIVCRYQAGKAGNDNEIFVGGLLVASSQGTLAPSAVTSFSLPIWGANSSGISGLLNGDVAAIIAYNRALTDLEIQQLTGGISY